MALTTTTNFGLPKPAYGDSGATEATAFNAAMDAADTAMKAQMNSVPTATATGTDTITATYSPAVTLTAGTRVLLIAAGANTGAATFAPNSLTAKAIKKYVSTALVAGDIPAAGYPCDLEYDGTNYWILINPSTETRLGAANAPSATELSYVKGVTSAIETQLGLLAPAASPTFTGTVTLPVGLTGVPKLTTGVVSIATPGTDYIAPINPAPANLGFSGTLITATAGDTVGIGDICYLNTDGKYHLAKSDVANTKMPGVVMATATISANASGVFLLWGYIRSDSWTWGSGGSGVLTVGGLVYVSITGTTTHTATQTAPSASGNIVQVVGQAVGAQTMFFAPCYTQVTVT